MEVIQKGVFDTKFILDNLRDVGNQKSILVVDNVPDSFIKEVKVVMNNHKMLTAVTEFDDGYFSYEIGYRLFNCCIPYKELNHRSEAYTKLTRDFRRSSLMRNLDIAYSNSMAGEDWIEEPSFDNGINGPVFLTTKEQHPDRVVHVDIKPEIVKASFDENSSITFLLYLDIPKSLAWSGGTFFVDPETGEDIDIHQVENRLVIFSSTLPHGQIPHVECTEDRTVMSIQAVTKKGQVFYYT